MLFASTQDVSFMKHLRPFQKQYSLQNLWHSKRKHVPKKQKLDKCWIKKKKKKAFCNFLWPKILSYEDLTGSWWNDLKAIALVKVSKYNRERENSNSKTLISRTVALGPFGPI